MVGISVMTDWIWTGDRDGEGPVLLLAHGAGAPMDSAFMNRFADALTLEGGTVARFEFAYMAQRRTGGKKRPPPRADRLIDAFEAAIKTLEEQSHRPIFIGGKSMGGRVAAMVAGRPLTSRVRGVVCLGFPFHPPGKTDAGSWRLSTLEETHLPVLICQGERDPFGRRAELEALTLPDNVQLEWISNGDHDFGPTGRAEATLKGNILHAARTVGQVMKTRP